MKTALIIFACFIPATASIVCAAWCAVNRIDGWGWFLFVGVICAGVSYKNGEVSGI